MMHPAEIAKELRRYPFFSGFPEDSLLVFSTMAVPKDFAPGDKLLTQGESNHCLFFLRSGSLAVLVDNEKVTELNQPGDVVGEMSLINRRPVTASVQAITPVSVFEVSEEYLSRMKNIERYNFQALLDKVYATVLVDRLSRTNDKAKRFEIANRDLELAHQELKKINENLEGEIARRSKELVTKVRNLIQSHLQPTQALLTKWALNREESLDAKTAYNVLQSVQEVIDFLKPVTELDSKNGIFQSRRVLLVDSNKKQQNIAKLALAGTGVELSVASNLEEVVQKLQGPKFDLILCDAQLKDAALRAMDLQPKTPLVLITDFEVSTYLTTLREFSRNPFFVSRDVNDRTFTIKNISTTVAKILNQDFFGMDKYLAWGTKILEETVTGSECRPDLIQKIRTHFETFGVRSVFLDRVHIVTEELLMNAIYDAPVDAQGKSLYNHLPRTEKIHLDPTQQGKLRYGIDGVFLAVSVADPFGALTRDVMIKYLENCYSNKENTHPEGSQKGGAGRGLHMIVENSDLTIFNVKDGKTTEVISLFYLEAGPQTQHHPTFHVFFS